MNSVFILIKVLYITGFSHTLHLVGLILALETTSKIKYGRLFKAHLISLENSNLFHYNCMIQLEISHAYIIIKVRSVTDDQQLKLF